MRYEDQKINSSHCKLYIFFNSSIEKLFFNGTVALSLYIFHFSCYLSALKCIDNVVRMSFLITFKLGVKE